MCLLSGLIFYDTKVTVMNRVLNATVQRTADHAAPEITLDPLEIVGGGSSSGVQDMWVAVPKAARTASAQGSPGPSHMGAGTLGPPSGAFSTQGLHPRHRWQGCQAAG